jgi:hypothetical protein
MGRLASTPLTILVCAGLALAQAVPQIPGAPVALRASVSDKGTLLTWGLPTESPVLTIGYEIARASLASGPFKTLGSVSAEDRSFCDTGAKPEVIYFYKIRAIGKEGSSSYSKPASAEISGRRAKKPTIDGARCDISPLFRPQSKEKPLRTLACRVCDADVNRQG